MEKFTQLLYSAQGFPERVSNVKKKLFSDYYDEIYNDNFNIESSKRLIENYFAIDAYYSNENISSYDQKIFYIIYIINKYSVTIIDADKLLSNALSKYPEK